MWFLAPLEPTSRSNGNIAGGLFFRGSNSVSKMWVLDVLEPTWPNNGQILGALLLFGDSSSQVPSCRFWVFGEDCWRGLLREFFGSGPFLLHG